MSRAVYCVATCPEALAGVDCLVIRDIGHLSGGTSVTNGAEGVVRELADRGWIDSRRLFYYDSEGQLDELLHDGRGGFLGFAPGPGRGE